MLLRFRGLGKMFGGSFLFFPEQMALNTLQLIAPAEGRFESANKLKMELHK